GGRDTHRPRHRHRRRPDARVHRWRPRARVDGHEAHRLPRPRRPPPPGPDPAAARRSPGHQPERGR
ncbi:MAG: UDP-N-acetylglucosamine 1-carboxyvinyltransferase, partial [uncultured Blastococcus sp.]